MGIQAPGTKEGVSSSDVAYGLSLRLDGHPSQEQIAAYQTEALQGTRILEHGVGQDVAASAPATVSTEWDARLKALREGAKLYDRHGKDIRGRLYSEDVEQYLVPLYQAAFQTAPDSAGADNLQKTFSERVQALHEYWSVAPGVVHNRDLWRPFLIHNHLSEDTPRDAAALAAESSLNALISKGGLPTADWAGDTRALDKAYVDERSRLARKVALDSSTVTTYRRRKSTCPGPVHGTSGKQKPRPLSSSHSLEEFYPQILKEQGVEGLVVLSVKVNSFGCVMEAAVVGSSGSDEFDEAALKWVETASFLPAEKDGKPVDGVGPVAVDFKLE